MNRKTKVTQAALDRQAAYNNHIKLAKEQKALIKEFVRDNCERCLIGVEWDEEKQVNKLIIAIHSTYERILL